MALIASPVAALTLDTTTRIGSCGMICPPVDPADSTGPATGDDGEQTTIARPPMASGLRIDPESAFNGNRVVSSDGVESGVVQEVVTQSDGSKHLVAARSGATDMENRFTLTVDRAATADDKIIPGWTEAELSATIDAL